MEYICKPNPFKGSRKRTYRLVEGVLSIDNGTEIPLERIESLQTIFFPSDSNYKAIIRSNTSKIVIHGINWIKGEKFIEAKQVDKFVEAIKQSTSHKYTIIEGSFTAYITKWALRIFVWFLTFALVLTFAFVRITLRPDIGDEDATFFLILFIVTMIGKTEEYISHLPPRVPRKYSSIGTRATVVRLITAQEYHVDTLLSKRKR